MPGSVLHFNLEDDTWWAANAVLPSWNGFQPRAGADGSQSFTEPSASALT